MHDFGHSGTTRRADAVPAPVRADLSNEEFAALRVHTLFREILSPEEITYIQTGILATTFGQPELGYGPRSDSEKILAFADIADFMDGRDTSIENGLNVLRETSAEKMPENFEHFIENRKNFLAYCRTLLLSLRDVFDKAEEDKERDKERKEKTYYEQLGHALDGMQIALLTAEHMEQYRSEFEEIRKEKGLS
jgi:hypothetical protein